MRALSSCWRSIRARSPSLDRWTRRSGRLPGLKVFAASAALAAVAACSTLSTSPAPALEPGASWALLPIVNQTETPQAGLRAESIGDSVMRSDARVSMLHYPSELNTDGLFDPTQRKGADAALDWARGAQARYALTGTVDEWRYKVGIDGEPAVGLTLRLIDVATGQVVWSGTGGKTGGSREAVSAVAQKLARGLTEPLARANRAAPSSR